MQSHLLIFFYCRSGEARPAEGIPKSLSVGQVVWAPSPSNNSQNDLVFVGWSSEIGPQNVERKLGMKVCYNRPCALYAVKAPFCESDSDELRFKCVFSYLMAIFHLRCFCS